MTNKDGVQVHVPFTNTRCSCCMEFEFETDLMKHIDKHMPPEAKKKQMDLFEETT